MDKDRWESLFTFQEDKTHARCTMIKKNDVRSCLSHSSRRRKMSCISGMGTYKNTCRSSHLNNSTIVGVQVIIIE